MSISALAEAARREGAEETFDTILLLLLPAELGVAAAGLRRISRACAGWRWRRR